MTSIHLSWNHWNQGIRLLRRPGGQKIVPILAYGIFLEPAIGIESGKKRPAIGEIEDI